MKIAVIIVRVLLGLLYLMSAVVVIFKLVPMPPMQGAAKTFNEGMMAAKYLMPLIKGTELVCALLLVSGFFAPLATVMIFPVTLNIFFYHFFVDPSGHLMSAGMLIANLFLAWAYRKHYKDLLSSKAILS